ncbi:hypothetical protein [Bacillus sp. FJAT-47783]|uniref:hypothetical protein n=1 Tax=Bacillus sp. FJAT-47783 TaxID=2922712 RepID=UPI00325FA453
MLWANQYIVTCFFIPALAGPFILAAVAYSATGIVFFLFLKLDPLIIARLIEQKKAQMAT